MLTDKEFTYWAERLGLTLTHTEKLRQIRSHGPVRGTGGSRSLRGLYSSEKMKRGIQFESRTGEFCACILFECEEEVLEYWDQPTTLRIEYEVQGGKKGSHDHIPDYLVIRGQSAAFVEVKHRAKLDKSLITTPGRFVEEGRRWRCPSGEAQAQTLFGIGYEVFVPEELPGQLISNINFLRNHSIRIHNEPTAA